jgi:hypothetical protein
VSENRVMSRMMERGKSKHVKNLTSRGDGYSTAISTNVNTMTKSRRTELRIMYKEL